MKIVLTPALDGPSNMDIDVALLERAALGEGPFLRLYSWDGPWVSLGYGQTPDRAVRPVASIGVVRRPTGGKALLHDRDVTYSVALPPSHPLARVSICESYKAISRRLVEALSALGVTATLGCLASEASRGGVVPCATEINIESVLVDGKKLIGSAQVRRRGAVLQHGSIPVAASSDRTIQAVQPPSDTRALDLFARWYRERTTTLEESGHAVPAARVREAVLEALVAL